MKSGKDYSLVKKVYSVSLIYFDVEAHEDDKNHSDYIFPEYFIIPVDIFNGEVKDNLDEWIYAFKNSEVKEEFKAPGIKEMGQKLNFISMTSEKQKAYRKYQEDLASDRGTLEFNALKAKKEEKFEIAKTGKENNVPFETIALMTGLSIDEIGEL